MPDAVRVVTNLPDFQRDLAALGQRVQRRVATRAARAAGRVFREAAKALAPRRTGALARGLYVGRSRRSTRSTLVFTVGVRSGKRAGKRGDPFYWRFLEGGWIPSGGKRRRGGLRSRALQRERALAAGARRVSHPFLDPAFRQRGAQALAEFNRVMTQGIAEEAARVR